MLHFNTLQLEMEKAQALEHARNFLGGSWNDITEDDIEANPFG